MLSRLTSSRNLATSRLRMHQRSQSAERSGRRPRRLGSRMRKPSHWKTAPAPLPSTAARMLLMSSKLFLHLMHSTEVAGSLKSPPKSSCRR